ncbi:MAG: cysteine hydrolase [Coriobacteriaceae bacterium]|jgi:nicotinamidase-related amidase|nr:cysteine hydrolase [Coriobacteriaceae bacterium]
MYKEGAAVEAKRLLLVVDYQNDFVNGSLGFPGAEALEGPIAEKIAEYRASGDEVAFTLDTHGPSYLETLEGRNLPVEHCLTGTEGARLFGKVAVLQDEGDQVFTKPSFGSLSLLEYLQGRQLEAAKHGTLPFSSIELVGLVSNICVLANAVIAKTAVPEVPVIVDASATASFDEALHEKALDVMEGIHIQVINRIHAD